MELDALPKDEGVGQAVFGDLIALGNCRIEISFCIRFHETFIDIEEDLSGSCRGRRYVRIQAGVQISGNTYGDLSAFNGFSCRFGIDVDLRLC